MGLQNRPLNYGVFFRMSQHFRNSSVQKKDITFFYLNLINTIFLKIQKHKLHW